MQGDQPEPEEPRDEGEDSQEARSEPSGAATPVGAGDTRPAAPDVAPAGDGGAGGGGENPANGGGDGGAGPSGTRTVSLAAPAARTVDLEDQTDRVGVGSGTFLQRSGVTLFIVVLTVVSFVLIALFINLFRELGQVPRSPGGDVLRAAFQRGDTAQALRLATHYRAVSDVVVAQRDSAWAHFIQGVKELIVAVFLPLLTGILGYIFGTRNEPAAGAAED